MDSERRMVFELRMDSERRVIGERPPLQQPWLRAWQPLLTQLGPRDGDWLTRANELALTRSICVGNDTELRFVDAATLAVATYDLQIVQYGQVPSRLKPAPAACHDYFNALVWLGLPLAKAAIHTLQAQAIASDGISGRRGAQRDALTVFDENGLLLLCSEPSIATALKRFAWNELFVEQRANFVGNSACILFGHALMQKLEAPYKAICAHTWIVEVDQSVVDTLNVHGDRSSDRSGGSGGAAFAAIDAILAQAISERQVTAASLTPLPVLGIPGWWSANQAPTFYNDATVFRTARMVRPARPV